MFDFQRAYEISQRMHQLKSKGKTNDKVEFTSAAMPPVYHYIGNTGAVDELLLEGLPLGSFKGETYSLVNMKSQVGDAFVFLSDGLPEVF